MSVEDAPSSSSWLQSPLDNNILKSYCIEDSSINTLRRNKAIQVVNSKGTIRSFYLYIPSQLCSILSSQQNTINNNDTTQLRIILAIHGYGGRPIQEIRKWYNTATSLNAVILAPQGTITQSDKKLGFNGLECCGDPVTNEIDDIDFIINGVVEVFLDVLEKDVGDGSSIQKNANVVCTGFSNGGFMTSLLGLQTTRPSWLIGIIPTGGYQYNVNLYTNNKNPLPIMSHHGGRDSVVNPNGCCSSVDDSKSNCYFDIGSKQQTCTSVKTSFEMWSNINECSSTESDEDIVNDRRRTKRIVVVDKDQQQPIYTCWKGIDCIEPTNFCLWNNEGHSWGMQFPGINMTQSWMETIFHRAEMMRSNNLKRDHDNEDASVISSYYNHHPKKGRIVFSAVVTSFVLLLLLLLRYIVNKNVNGKVRKRKTSEEHILVDGSDHDIDTEKLVITVVD